MKAKKNKKLNIAAVFMTFCLVIAQLFVPVQAEAAGQINVNAHTMVEINYMYETEKMSGVHFSLYRVADISENGEYMVAQAFDSSELAAMPIDGNSTQQAADMFAAYIEQYGIEPIMSGETDADGILFFPSEGDKMRTGMYLIIGKTFERDGYTYEIKPILLSLPVTDGDDEWQYSVKVLPKSIRYIGEAPGGEIPEEPEVPEGELPQTGQLWWPVPVLLAAGMSLMIIGLLRGRRVDND